MRIKIECVATCTSADYRHSAHQDVASEYARAMEAGAQFPPVTVFFDGKAYWLADGYHRLLAADMAGQTEIEAEVMAGGERDAILYGVGANFGHGLRRNLADRVRAVRTLLADEEWGQWDDEEIARRCAVALSLVQFLRTCYVKAQRGAAPTEPATDPSAATEGVPADEACWVETQEALARVELWELAERFGRQLAAKADRMRRLEEVTERKRESGDNPAGGVPIFRKVLAFPTSWIDAFSAADLLEDLAAGRYEDPLVLARVEPGATWFQALCEYATAICFVRDDVRFLPSLLAVDEVVAYARAGQALIYFGPDVEAFADFDMLGTVLWARPPA